MAYDTIVIGIGLAGLTAGLRLGQAGQRVLLIAKGIGGTHLGGGTVDVLGYSGDRLVLHPADALSEFVRAHPDHPYARIGPAGVRVALEWFQRTLEVEGYPFVGSPEDNYLLPTAVGAARPTAMVPEGMAAGDLRAGGDFLIAGFRNLKDFFPALIADHLARAKLAGGAPVAARSALLDPPGLEAEADLPPLELARAFDRAEFRAALADRLRPHLRPGERVGFPALLGLADPVTAWRDLQARLGAPVFEIPTLPPSVPGMRVFERLKGALRKCGARIQIGFPAIEARVEDGRCTAVITQSANRTPAWRASHFILATGGVAGGGVQVERDGTAREVVFGLPLDGLPGPGEPRFLPGYFDRHPFNRLGMAVDERLRPLRDGRPAIANLHAAGAILGHAEPWREKSGDGIAVATGYWAAEGVLGSQGVGELDG